MSDQNDLQALSDRADRIINELAGAMLRTAEVAAERIELASSLAQMRQRMAAFTAVLEMIGAQKATLLEQQQKATGAMKALLGRQIEMLTAQEVAVLERVGVPTPAAQQAITVVDAVVSPEPAKVYRRAGRAFKRVPSTNGTANGHAHGTCPGSDDTPTN